VNGQRTTKRPQPFSSLIHLLLAGKLFLTLSDYSSLMKKLILIPLFGISVWAAAQKGYEIKVTLKPISNEYVYLGHYSGKQFPVIDSVKLNEKSEGVFKGDKSLGGGIYIIAYPKKDRFIEVLVDKQQHFSIIADTTDPIRKRKFVNSPENDAFSLYQQEMSTKGKRIDSLSTLMRSSGKPGDSTRLSAEIRKTTDEISTYRKQVSSKNPNSLLSVLMHLMEEPKVPPAGQHPGGKYDSTFAYRYFKDHYWDGVDFWDDRITRTPASLFEERVDKYFNTLVYPSPDSVNKEIDNMLAFASPSKEVTRVLLVRFVTRYLNMRYMWEDAVFVHLFEKYFAQKDYDWLTPQGKKLITDRAYSLMANIMGNPAENISLPDTAGVIKNLYSSDTARFTVVTFWDPTCGHCRETLPLLDSMYRAKWKTAGVKMYSVAKETDGTKNDWQNFIRVHHLEQWTNVYYSKEEENKRISAGIPGYSQLYDAQTVPAVFLLDKEKRIIAKKLTWQQTDEIIQLKLKQH
jgi:thiol-disulfide isomerase/thioredoxin